MISNMYYLLNKAENTVISQFQPEAKSNLLSLMLSKRVNNLNIPPNVVREEEQPFSPLRYTILFTL